MSQHQSHQQFEVEGDICGDVPPYLVKYLANAVS